MRKNKSHINKEKTFDKKFWVSIIPFLILVVFILFLPFIITSKSWFNLDFSNTGQIGDTIGGTIGPFIAIVAAFLTYIAFWIQYKANEQMRNDIRIDRLENRIYEMLSLHKQNVSEIEFMNKKGRETFPLLYQQLRYVYFIVEEYLNEKFDLEYRLEKKDLTSIAYTIFFIGINKKNNDHLKKLLLYHIDEETYYKLIEILISFKSTTLFTNHFGLQIEDEGNSIKSLILLGHGQRLGHYFRHLYQTINSIAENPLEKLSYDEKYKYVKLIRAQLSDYEQLLLYYSALSPFGFKWKENHYFLRYKLIKNIPLPLADFGLRPQELYAKINEVLENNGNELFEWSGVE